MFRLPGPLVRPKPYVTNIHKDKNRSQRGSTWCAPGTRFETLFDNDQFAKSVHIPNAYSGAFRHDEFLS